MTPTRVEIVPARRKGITGYANVGRGTLLGNPYKADVYTGNQAIPVLQYAELFRAVRDYRIAALRLLEREWPGGVVRIACPCNGYEKGQPCHATVIKEFLESEIGRRASK